MPWRQDPLLVFICLWPSDTKITATSRHLSVKIADSINSYSVYFTIYSPNIYRLDIFGYTICRFSDLTSLRKLYLENNPVTEVEGTVSLPGLQVLFLTLPQGGTVGGLPVFTELRTLSIMNTRVSFETSEPWFMDLPHLRHLAYSSGETLVDSDVTDIPVQVLGSRLTHLSLSNNSLPAGKSFWTWLNSFTAIESLDLSLNGMTSFDVNVFRDMPNLEELNLEGNRPTSISSGLFTDLHSLSGLNIRDNGITYINLNDDLSDIVPGLLIRLADNKWQCGCKLRWLKKLIDRQLAGESWHLEGHEILHQISCYNPEYLRGRLIKNILLDEMTCWSLSW